MSEKLTISKIGDQPAYLDYELLRIEGLAYIEKYAGKLWTDYNVHDPGITILELLCYAITDLGYRASFDIKDILTSKEGNAKNLKEQFITAKKILPNKPLTISDYRKLLIDVNGVNNAWIELTNVDPIFINCLESKLVHKKPPPAFPSKEISINGFYSATIEFDAGIKSASSKKKVIEECKDALAANRNLCEDFLTVEPIKDQEFIICAEVEIESDVNLSQIEARIFHELQQYLTPSVNQYSLAEMFDKGFTADEIFEGPILQNGFISDKELEDSDLRKSIYLSDIIHIIMDIPGVKAVREVLVNPKGQAISPENKWEIKINPAHRAKLSKESSKIVYYKESIPFQADGEMVEAELEKINSQIEQTQSEINCEDIPIPTGDYRSISDYYSIQNLFPQNYGIGELGLPDSSTPMRKAQTRQLKAYLLFFDQLLANCFQQLSDVGKIFSMSPEVNKTYFTQLVSTDERIKELYFDFNNAGKDIQDLTEKSSQFEKRRNNFLDHLISRFAETFSEYAAIIFSIAKQNDYQELIDTKINFLQNYSDFSASRACGINYRSVDELWDTALNVTGLEKRLASLINIKNYSRRNLINADFAGNVVYELYEEKDDDDITEYRFRIYSDDKSGIMLSSSTRYPDKQSAIKEMEVVTKFATDRSYYQLKMTKDERCYFNIVDDTGEIVGRRIEYFKTEEERENAIRELLSFAIIKSSDEGMFVVDHLLLAPKSKQDPLLPICVEADCSDCQHVDPYSFRISVILPAWTKRFSNINFRRYVEKIIRMETPSHILPRVCWIDELQMSQFEMAYRKWLKLNASNHKDRAKALGNFITVLASLKNVYDEAFLFDCGKNQDNSFVLNKTNLGTKKK